MSTFGGKEDIDDVFPYRPRLKPSHPLASPAPILIHRGKRTEPFDGSMVDQAHLHELLARERARDLMLPVSVRFRKFHASGTST